MCTHPGVRSGTRVSWRRHRQGFWNLALMAGLFGLFPVHAAEPMGHAYPGISTLASTVAATIPIQNPQSQRPRENVNIADFSVVEIRTKGVPGARSGSALGRTRQGGGIVIDDHGLILTVEYLVTEAETIEVHLANRQTVPASLIGYDSASGLGLIRTAVPVDVPPITFAHSEGAKIRDPVLVVGFDGVAPAYIVSRREYAGSREYLLEDALFTAPATTGWSGAALIDRGGKLLGVGSLLVKDALGPQQPLAGNMFVPIDVLKPILEDLIQYGRASGPARPWLGVHVEDISGRVLITQVSDDGPAARSGLGKGDIILGVNGNDLAGLADFYRRLWSSGNAGDQIRLKVLKGSKIEDVVVTSMERAQYLRPQAMF